MSMEAGTPHTLAALHFADHCVTPSAPWMEVFEEFGFEAAHSLLNLEADHKRSRGCTGACSEAPRQIAAGPLVVWGLVLWTGKNPGQDLPLSPTPHETPPTLRILP
jgi:hypothetical protein